VFAAMDGPQLLENQVSNAPSAWIRAGCQDQANDSRSLKRDIARFQA